MDHRGTRYLDPGNPSLGDHSRNRAREEEITEEILDKLDWIKGVRVQVQVTTPRTRRTRDDAGRRCEGSRHRKCARLRRARRPVPRSTTISLLSEPLMAANHPLSIGGDR